MHWLDRLSPRDLKDLEYLQCAKDPVYWVTRHGYIKDESSGREYHGLDLWPGYGDYPGQLDLFSNYIQGLDLEVLKARQDGISWICGNADYWDLQFGGGVRLGILDKREPDAFKHIERIKLIHRAQPKHIARRQPKHGHDSKSEFALGEGSDSNIIESHVCSVNAARGITAKRIRLEEYAFYPHLPDILAAVRGATADTGRQVVAISTANGEGTEHHQSWQDAVEGKIRGKAMFFPWQIHPERNEEWYQDTLINVFRGDINRMRQEFPATPDEAFIASGTKFFTREFLDLAYRPLEYHELYPGWEVYKRPEPDGRYVIGCDPADAGGDHCSADVLDASNGEQVAHLNSPDWDAGSFTDHVVTAGQMYNDALIVWERENHGHKCIERTIQTHRYDRVYKHDDGKYGHPTNAVTRPFILDSLQEGFMQGAVMLHSTASYRECVAFAYVDGKPQAPGKGTHDDRVFSLAKALVGLPYAAAGRRPVRVFQGSKQIA